ncbi:MAG: hypothetical protein E7535_08550 [Ruminococcaceae bacterium]|nr:hypothetical protein [Oscillospiraceae bacterium]
MKITPDFKRLNSGENISRGLEISLSEGLRDKKCVITFITPMGKIFVTEPLEITDGCGTYELPSLLLDGKGVLFCQLGLSSEDGFLIKSRIYEFPVYASCDTEEFPAATDESIKSLSAIFGLLDQKAEREHSHDERYYTEAETDILLFSKAEREHSHGEFYTKEETGALLDTKAEKEHSHQYSSLSEKPGDKISEDLVIYNLLPVFTPPENSDVTGKMFPFTHNIKGYVNTSVLTLEYKVPDCPIIFGEQRFINFEPLSDGGYFIPFGKAVSYAEFFANGFGEISPDTLAAAVILSSDGTGKIYIRNDIEGIWAKLSIKNALTGYVKLPMEAVDYTEKAEENDKRLITSGGVYNAINEELGKLPEIPENVSAFKNDVGYLTEHQSLAEYPKRTETEKFTADALSAHNVNESAHQDIRLLLQGLSERINAVLDSDDTTLDQLSEIVSYIKSNKELIDAVTTKKISYSDIVNDLETNVGNKPLSAAMGVALKALIDAITIPTKVSQLQNDSNFVSLSDFSKTFSVTAKINSDSQTVSEVSHSATEIAEAVSRGDSVILVAEVISEEITSPCYAVFPLTKLIDNLIAIFSVFSNSEEAAVTVYNNKTASLSVNVLSDSNADGICHIGAFLTMDENGKYVLQDITGTVSEMLEMAAENKRVLLDIALDGDIPGDHKMNMSLAMSSQNEAMLLFCGVVEMNKPTYVQAVGSIEEGADLWRVDLIELERSDSTCRVSAFLTMDEDGKYILQDVGYTISEILEKAAENKRVFLDIALDGDISGDQKIRVPLVMSAQNEKVLLFSGITETNGPTYVQIAGNIYEDTDIWTVNLTTLVSASDYARLTLRVSDTVPTVDDPSVITFVIEG